MSDLDDLEGSSAVPSASLVSGDNTLTSLAQSTPSSRTSSSHGTVAGTWGTTIAGLRWKPSVFDFKSGRSGSTCPTCKGAGLIPRGKITVR